ncbi:adenylate kinase, partial [Dissostichus eleginoides]
NPVSVFWSRISLCFCFSVYPNNILWNLLPYAFFEEHSGGCEVIVRRRRDWGGNWSGSLSLLIGLSII